MLLLKLPDILCVDISELQQVCQVKLYQTYEEDKFNLAWAEHPWLRKTLK